jgi:transcriptional regulator with XRE-family HTH domain
MNPLPAGKTNRSPATLGVFLRSHRERISPNNAAATRRRTPGLRREEVAQLCGVSTTWYTWLEQGRQVSASAGTLARIATALNLTRAERAYLFEIAGVLDPEDEQPSPAEIPSSLASLIAAMPVPAYLLDRQWNAIAWNGAAFKLLKPWLQDVSHRNLLRFVFLSPAAKELIVDWSERGRRVVAEFRADSGRHVVDPPTRRLLENLQTNSSFFARLWKEQDVKTREGSPRRFRSSSGKVVSYEQVALAPAPRSDLKLITLVPSRAKR